MSEDQGTTHPTLALNTKVEEDFIAPLTALRGSLEILRDFPDLAPDERLRFLDTALRGCSRLEQAVKELGESVYAAGHKAHATAEENVTPEAYKSYAERIKIPTDSDMIEIDFSDFAFSSNQIVNQFYDVLDELIESTGRKWYFIVNYRNCRVWPEAWVAFAHRGKKVNVTRSLGTVRYTEPDPSDEGSGASAQPDGFDPDMFPSRELALARLEEMKQAASG
ncbi:MAG: hypothetical protein AAF563_06860 [Pseudomonadota bacterium]